MDVMKMAHCLASSLTDCVLDSEGNEITYTLGILSNGLRALAMRDLKGIKELFNDGYTFPLGLDPDEFDGFIGVQVTDGDELIGIIDKSDINW